MLAVNSIITMTKGYFMGEAQVETIQSQQQPFTEKALLRMDKWLKTAGPEITGQPQSNIDRLFLLKNYREVFYDSGFHEEGGPKYEKDGDKSSDIVMTWDTLTDGFLTLRLELDNLTSIIQTAREKEDLNPSDDQQMDHSTLKFINEILEIKKRLRDEGINVEPSLIDFHGEEVKLPKEAIKSKGEPEPDEPLKTVPLNKQNLHYDLHSGNWHGSPKK